MLVQGPINSLINPQAQGASRLQQGRGADASAAPLDSGLPRGIQDIFELSMGMAGLGGFGNSPLDMLLSILRLMQGGAAPGGFQGYPGAGRMLPGMLGGGTQALGGASPMAPASAARQAPAAPRPTASSRAAAHVQPRSSAAQPAQPATARAAVQVRPQAQSNSVSCGQASVAMAVNALTGKSLTDRDINARHGFNLLGALNSETGGSGYRWSDKGNLTAGHRDMIKQKLDAGLPVIVGLNGPEFSPSGYGHIVTLTGMTDDGKVTFADPNGGRMRTTTWDRLLAAPPHSESGNFVLAPSR